MQYFAFVGCQRLGRLTWRSLNLPMSSRACLILRAVPRRTNKKIGQITTWRPQERNRIQSNSASRTKSRKSTSKRARRHYMSHLIRPRNTRCAVWISSYMLFILSSKCDYKIIFFFVFSAPIDAEELRIPDSKLNWKCKTKLFFFPAYMLTFFRKTRKILFTIEKKIVKFEDAPHGAARHYMYHNAPFYKSMRK